MYYSGDISKLYLTNTAIIGKRESGKTTLLKKIVNKALLDNYTILLFDTVTDHPSKSILIHCLNTYTDTVLIDSPSKGEIVFSNHSSFDFPYKEIKNKKTHLFLFDVSKYLEEGYFTEDLMKREEIREYYKRLVIQELFVMNRFLSSQKCLVVTDEVEFIPEIREILLQYIKKDIHFVCALHEEESLSTSKDLFNILRLGGNTID